MDASLRSGPTLTGGAGVRRLRRVLVAAQFAIATPLLIVAATVARQPQRTAPRRRGRRAAQCRSPVDVDCRARSIGNNGRMRAFWRRAPAAVGSAAWHRSGRIRGWPCRRTPPVSTTTSISSSSRPAPAGLSQSRLGGAFRPGTSASLGLTADRRPPARPAGSCECRSRTGASVGHRRSARGRDGSFPMKPRSASD